MGQHDLLAKLTADVIEVHSPSELLLVRYYDPSRKDAGQTSRGPQGFGGEAAVALLLPFIYKFFEKVIDRLSGKVADQLSRLLADFLSARGTARTENLMMLVKAELISEGLADEKASAVAITIVEVLDKNRGKLPV